MRDFSMEKEKTAEEIEADSIILKDGGKNGESDGRDASPMNFIHDTVYSTDYWKNMEGLIEKPKGIIQRLYEKYENAKIKPYISFVDLNENSRKDDDLYKSKPKVAYEIGIKIKF